MIPIFIRMEVLKNLARKADPNKPFKIIISCDNKWTDIGGGVMTGPETTYSLVQEGKVFPLIGDGR